MPSPLLCIDDVFVLTPAGTLVYGLLLLEDGVVRYAGPREGVGGLGEGILRIAGEGMWALPGFVDVHVHFREPGGTHKETIASGSRAAARGGFTAVLMMANTVPPPDTPERLREMRAVARRTAVVRTFAAAPVTRGQAGEFPVDFVALAAAGARAFSDDGLPVLDPLVLRAALSASALLRLPVLLHEEDPSLSRGGVVHPSPWAAGRGLPTYPPESETSLIGRDLALAAFVPGARIHLQHLSSRVSVELVRRLRPLLARRGVRLTAEATPHHLVLTWEDVCRAADLAAEADLGRERRGTSASARVSIRPQDAKMNPPLRESADRDALVRALREGIVDFVATDHAPHAPEEKALPLERAPFGILGLETAFPLLYTELVLRGRFSLGELVDRMSRAPARFLGIPGGELAAGAPADLVLVDPYVPRPVLPERLASKSRNTPFFGRTLRGWPVLTLVGGRVAYADFELFSHAVRALPPEAFVLPSTAEVPGGEIGDGADFVRGRVSP
ncbi:MAG: dihydroorotase [Brockia lithotrophica]|nr:dihydroorotase [Brockia lithotrophica]